jgi:quercetin dioxygenase-like cupin family protein
LGLSLFPQLLFFYDQLLLWMIPRSAAAGLVFSALSWAAYFGWRLSGVDAATGEILSQPARFILACVYLPALLMVLTRPIRRAGAYRRPAATPEANAPVLDQHLTPAAGREIIWTMELRITRWNKAEQPSETDLRRIYTAEGLSPYTWSNAAGDVYPAHAHGYHKVLMVVRGSITWALPQSGQQIETHAGDRIDLPRGTLHAARVGPDGVTCLEAHIDGQ